MLSTENYLYCKNYRPGRPWFYDGTNPPLPVRLRITIPPAGFEPAALGLGNQCSILLSYGGRNCVSSPWCRRYISYNNRKSFVIGGQGESTTVERFLQGECRASSSSSTSSSHACLWQSQELPEQILVRYTQDICRALESAGTHLSCSRKRASSCGRNTCNL